MRSRGSGEQGKRQDQSRIIVVVSTVDSEVRRLGVMSRRCQAGMVTVLIVYRPFNDKRPGPRSWNKGPRDCRSMT